jgi:hypothetical protein
MKYKRYLGTIYHRGVELEVRFYATSAVDAAKQVGETPYRIRNYFMWGSNEDSKEFDGVRATMKGDKIKKLIGVVLPLEEAKAIINKHGDAKWKRFRKQHRLDT